MKIYLLALFLALPASQVYAASSVSCADPHIRFEQMICSDAMLSNKDDEMFKLFSSNLGNAQEQQVRNSIVQSQLEWVGGIRNKCKTLECMYKAYDRRIVELQEKAFR